MALTHTRKLNQKVSGHQIRSPPQLYLSTGSTYSSLVGGGSSSQERKSTLPKPDLPIASSRKGGQVALERFEVLDSRDKEIRKSEIIFDDVT